VFLGHFAVGFGAKAVAPRVSLGTLFLAAQFIDLLWPVLVLLGVEQVRIDPGATVVTPLDFEHYPVSHSLLAVVGWGVLLAGIYFLVARDRRGSMVVGLVVASHWLLDFLVHRPDLPLYPGGVRVGLGIWQSLPATLVMELGLFGVGLFLYRRVTEARDAIGHWALWALAVLLVAIYAGNLSGPPPPSATAIAWVGQTQWLLVVWGYWIDRHRKTR
jgi:FtsH-binding integral membrane protein